MNAMGNFKDKADQLTIHRRVSVGILKWCGFFSSQERCASETHFKARGILILFPVVFCPGSSRLIQGALQMSI